MDRTTTSPEFRPTRIWMGSLPFVEPLRVSLDGFLDSQRRIASADGVILLGNWRPKERHDPSP